MVPQPPIVRCHLLAFLASPGGFNVSLEPAFSASRLTWLRGYGGVFAQANLRGGGEYGIDWRNAGSKANKQNVFDDFQVGGMGVGWLCNCPGIHCWSPVHPWARPCSNFTQVPLPRKLVQFRHTLPYTQTSCSSSRPHNNWIL